MGGFAAESNVVVDDKEFGATLTQSLKLTMDTDAPRIFSDSRKHQSVGLRFMSWLSYGLLRSMMGISGYSRDNSRTEKARTSAPDRV